MKSISSEVISNLKIPLFTLNFPRFSAIHYDTYSGVFSTQNTPEDLLNRPKRPNAL